MPSKEVTSALEHLHKELEKLEPAIRHVEAAQEVTQTVKQIPNLHLALLQSVKEEDEKLKNELTQLFKQELTGLAEENKKLQQTTSQIQENAIAEQAALSLLKDKVAAFHERVEKINFPERLDKLDANIAGIMAAVQAIQSRIDIVEHNLIDRLRDIQTFQKESQASIQTTVEQSKAFLKTEVMKVAQKQKVLAYVTWGLIVAVAVAGFLIKGNN